MQKRPNIIIIMSDQHTPNVLGCYGNALAQTPNIDRLAAEGARFDNAYCNNPVCVPSRMSMLTGMRSSKINVWCNADCLSPHFATWPLLLRLAGYDTIISGRNHMLWGDRLHGFGRRLCGDDSERIPTVKDECTTVGRASKPQGITKQLGACDQTTHAGHDIRATQHATDFIANAPDKPFALFLGLYQPHAPFVALPEYFGLYAKHGDELHAQHVGEYTDAPIHPYQKWTPNPLIDEKTHATAIQAYYGMVSHVDALVGRVMAALESRGMLDNTIVIYTSDHGEMLGRHNLWHKMVFYEDSVRIPLVWRAPQTTGTKIPRNVSLLDLFPTLLDMAEYEADLPLDGRSLMPLLRGDTGNWDNAVMAETIGVTRGEPGRMLKRDHLKLICYHNQPPVLFDLESDPRETRDIAGDPAYRARLDAMLKEISRDWNVAEINRTFDAGLRQIKYHHQATLN